MTEEINIELHRLTNPSTFVRFAPRVVELAKKLESPNILYEGLFMYLLQTVQTSEYLLKKTAKPLRELTFVTIDKNAVAFAHWYIKALPLHVGTACWDFVYVWGDNTDEIETSLINRFIAFGRRNKCEFFNVETDDIVEGKVFEEKGMNFTIEKKNIVLWHK